MNTLWKLFYRTTIQAAVSIAILAALITLGDSWEALVETVTINPKGTAFGMFIMWFAMLMFQLVWLEKESLNRRIRNLEKEKEK